ncbi:WD40/YVTN/BNR-like repeat-containing protein [Marinobacterium aestuariivivens]|uniref:WD40/YVTN/BNR-like repeat-containing protein n=1 Tax=Marinobacterium aestuariivivens TaxID=1698799 RepID=A0ABW2A8X6_9GAMM
MKKPIRKGPRGDVISASAGPTPSTLKPLLLGLALTLTGCEAPLNLDGIERQRQEAVRRTDQLQALTANDRVRVAVGNDGLVLTSPVDALQWQRHRIDAGPGLIDVDVCPDQSLLALAAERQLWRSRDHGQSWQAIDLPTAENVLAATCAPDGSYWVVGSFSTLLSSADQGRNWQQSSLDEDAMLTGIQFVDRNTAFVSGEFGILARSDDGGRDWSLQPPVPGDFYPQAAYFRDDREGWVVGLDGRILHSGDGGSSWSAQSTPVKAPLYGIAAAGADLYAVGENGTVLKARAGRWERQDAPVIPGYLRAALALGDGRLLVAGGGGTLLPLPLALER